MRKNKKRHKEYIKKRNKRIKKHLNSIDTKYQESDILHIRTDEQLEIDKLFSTLEEKVKNYKNIKPEIFNLNQISYNEYLNYLIEKYGPVKDDYAILNKEKGIAYKNKNIFYPASDLYIHHIKENIISDLSYKENFYCYFDYQKKENLVFCNLYEHCILHILISIEDKQNYYRLGRGGLLNHNMLYLLYHELSKFDLSQEDYEYLVYVFLKNTTIKISNNNGNLMNFLNFLINKEPYKIVENVNYNKYNYEELLKNYPVGISKISGEIYNSTICPSKFALQYTNMYVLRSSLNIFMFIAEKANKELVLFYGGNRKKLSETDINYYYNNLDLYYYAISILNNQWNSVLKPISDYFKSLGGSGNIHGRIVDFDYYSHVKIDPYEKMIIPYSAESVQERTIYSTLNNFLESLNIDKSKLLDTKNNFYEKTLTNTTLTIFKENEIKGLTVPLFEKQDSNSLFDTSSNFYKDNKNILDCQKTFKNKIISIWDDQFDSYLKQYLEKNNSLSFNKEELE